MSVPKMEIEWCMPLVRLESKEDEKKHQAEEKEAEKQRVAEAAKFHASEIDPRIKIHKETKAATLTNSVDATFARDESGHTTFTFSVRGHAWVARYRPMSFDNEGHCHHCHDCSLKVKTDLKESEGGWITFKDGTEDRTLKAIIHQYNLDGGMLVLQLVTYAKFQEFLAAGKWHLV